jgi:hypothetical protein
MTEGGNVRLGMTLPFPCHPERSEGSPPFFVRPVISSEARNLLPFCSLPVIPNEVRNLSPFI